MDTIGGYRIIRKLGSGERSDVYLGRAAPIAGGEATLAAIKVFKAGVASASIDGEIAALSRLRHSHVVRLLDLATGPTDSPCLVLQRLAPGGLPALLADRRTLQLGEAVTVLAPVVAAVAAMHREGVVHGRLGARAILFDGAGAPMIMGFGASACFAVPGADTSEAALDSQPLVAADRLALRGLVRSVLGRTTRADIPGDEFTRWLADGEDAGVELAELERRIFDLAEPMGVQFAIAGEPTPAGGRHGVPGRLGSQSGSAGQPHQKDVARASDSAFAVTGRRADLLSALPPEIASWISARLKDVPSGAVARLTALTGQLRHQLGSVRRRVWVIAAMGMVAVAFALTIPGPSEQQDEIASSPSAEAASPVIPSAISGDDPVAAAGELLTLRARCLADRSVLCLDAVHAPGSAAWQADATRIREVQDGAELHQDAFPPGSTATLVEQLGQTALLALTQGGATPANTTASVLLIRTEAGWRFRSLLADSASLDVSP